MTNLKPISSRSGNTQLYTRKFISGLFLFNFQYFALPISRRLPVVAATNRFATSYCETGNQVRTYLENVISQFVQSLFFFRKIVSPSPLSNDVLREMKNQLNVTINLSRESCLLQVQRQSKSTEKAEFFFCGLFLGEAGRNIRPDQAVGKGKTWTVCV